MPPHFISFLRHASAMPLHAKLYLCDSHQSNSIQFPCRTIHLTSSLFHCVEFPCYSIAILFKALPSPFYSKPFHRVSKPFCDVPWQLYANLCLSISMLFHAMPLRSITLICSAFAAQNPAIPLLLIASPSPFSSFHCDSMPWQCGSYHVHAIAYSITLYSNRP